MNDEKILTLDQLAEIEERASKATPHVWLCTDGCSVWLAGDGRAPWDKAIGNTIAEIGCGDESYKNHEADAQFIAHSRTDVPALCATVRAQAERIERLNAKVVAVVPLLEGLYEMDVRQNDDFPFSLTDEFTVAFDAIIPTEIDPYLDRLIAENERLKARVAELETAEDMTAAYMLGYEKGKDAVKVR